MQSFDFGQAEAAIADGFPPDTISSDQYLRHVGLRPQHDLPRTLSKLLAIGMPEADAFAAVTARPARILGLAPEVGQLTPEACADVTALRWNPEAAPLFDASGATRPGGCWEPVLTVRAGQIVARSA
jgi:dihydroorotase